MSFTLKRALLSVSDKTGIIELAQKLASNGVEILSTGGTAKALRDANIPVIDVGDYTGFPEILDGRVKTLHPKVHAGILARRAQDTATLEKLDIPYIDLVVVNLYPFANTIAKPNCSFEEAIEQIDIGGPSMLRGAAKNYQDVAVVVDPNDYPLITEQLTLEQRLMLAQKVFAHTAHYDALINDYLSEHTKPGLLPKMRTLALTEQLSLRYGENPHQAASFYQHGIHKTGLAASIQHQGKPLSYNNLLDADAAMECVKSFTLKPACVIVKHTNPCGVAQADDLLSAYQRAYQADPSSAFGGIIAFNKKLDEKTAQAIIDTQFVEVILAPEFSEAALTILNNKPNVRALTYSSDKNTDPLSYRSINGGLLVQEQDTQIINPNDWKIVTTKKPDATQLQDLTFAWQVVRFVKSNAIVYAKNGQTCGIGAGQTSRIMSCEIGIMKAQQAGLSLKACALASDAFFPFADSIIAASKAGVTSIIQPGGSLKDQEVINAANDLNIAMIFTGIRHFRH
ncbi:MAG: bifunctional phosphoribosylaminoimidazolecarboxamide formyltransferase/IMP cyclohydrolase [Legionellales bacterium]|jgi:phosphoribosylaminoimidazolecarboxamide formyltransferase/IMP cyclohydrolase